MSWDLFDWEMSALRSAGLESETAIQHTCFATIDKWPGTGSAWWPVAFFAPQVWERWRVGLLHGSLNLWADSPVTLPSPVRFKLPDEVGRWIDPKFAERWAEVDVCPAIVNGRALGFVIRMTDADPPEYCETFAPTHLKTRLNVDSGDRVRLELLSPKDRKGDK